MRYDASGNIWMEQMIMVMRSLRILTLAATLTVLAPFTLAACSDDDDNPQEQASDIASASASAEENTIDLVCPPPIGNVTVTTNPDDDWSPGYIVGSDQVLYPVAFGEITFTDAGTRQTHVDSPIAKEGADTTGAVNCSFTDEVDEEGAHGTVTGTVTVVQRAP